MSSPHNPITGAMQHNVSVPDRPVTPAAVRAAHARQLAKQNSSSSSFAAAAAVDAKGNPLPQRRYGRHPNPWLDADGLAPKYGAHHEKLRLMREQQKQQPTSSAASASSSSAPAASAAAPPAAAPAPAPATAAAASRS